MPSPPSQKIFWTLLPVAIDQSMTGNQLRASVIVSPRLVPNSGAARLDTFPDFLSWPSRLISMKFQVEFQGSGKPPVPATRISSDPDAALYANMFHAETFVRPFAFQDFRNRSIRSYPGRHVLSYLKQTYRQVAETSPADLPALPFAANPNPAIAGFVGNLGAIADGRRDHMETQLAGVFKNQRALDPNDPAMNVANPLGFASRAELDFFQLDRFYDRPETRTQYRRAPDAALIPPSLPVPEIDFHQMVSALADYPELMRRLGFVFDLHFATTNIPSTGLRVVPVWTSNPPPEPDRTPYTKYILNATRFQAASATGEVSKGMLNLAAVNDQHADANNASLFDLTQIDPDGSGLKSVNFAGNMQRVTDKAKAANRGIAYTMADTGGLPSIRSAGLTLMRLGRAAQLAQRIAQQSAWHDALDANWAVRPVLSAEDVLRGYRVDILDQTANPAVWRSLCQRVGTYQVGSQSVNIAPDEGYVKAGSASSKDSASDLYFHESMFRWFGWSLCATRPGRTIRAVRAPGSLHQDESIEFIQSEPVPGVNMKVHFTPVPGSLPSLRFGHTYRLRARTVDMAGNSLSLSEADGAVSVSDPVTYSRFEPVDAPAIVPRARYTEGESFECMVIRSNYTMTAQQYIESQPVKDALKNKAHIYAVSNDRHFAPPKTSQLMAETHGMFDAALSNTAPEMVREHFYHVARKEAGTFLDASIVNIQDPANPIPVPGRQIIASPGTPPPQPGDPLAEGQYLVQTSDSLLLPYLPEPIARGAALRGLPGIASAGPLGPAPDVTVVQPSPDALVLHVPFQMNWPDATPFRFEIRERVPGVTLADGSETFSDSGVPKWDPAKRVLTVFLAKAQMATIRYSSYVDAKDLPLMGVTGWMNGSAQMAAFTNYATAGIHWMVTPFHELKLVHAVQQPLRDPSFPKLNCDRLIGWTYADLRGPMHLSAISSGKLDLLAQWPEPVDDLADTAPKLLTGKGHVADISIAYDSGDDQPLPPIQHQFGDTKSRAVDYRLEATTRFREYFPAEITDDPANVTRVGPVFHLKVPSSARPAAPKVLYILPTFGWDRHRAGSDVVSNRKGGGLRVYMDRPWYSSGDGELLGVVLREPAENIATPDPLKPYVTQIGSDPLYASDDPVTPPGVANFPGSVNNNSGLALHERNATVSVAGHEVAYDSDRQLWYSDIQVNAGTSYFPFIRLALARYQPESIPNAHLSAVVMTEFAQLAPDRTVNITFSADKKVLTVNVFGVAPTATGVTEGLKWDPQQARNPPVPPQDPSYGLNHIEVSVEVRDESVGTDLGWLPAKDATVASGSGISPSRSPIKPLWSGTLTFDQPVGGNNHRVVIREFEMFYEDNFNAFLQKDITKRMVYAEVIEV